MNRRIILISLLALTISGCCCPGGASPQPQQQIVVVPENDIPGTVRDTWAEPMYDTVKVQGQIDPANTYYRAPHQTVVEIRPGKFREVQFNGDPK